MNWWDVLKNPSARILSYAKTLHGRDYLFDNYDDPRIPVDNPEKQSGYHQLSFIERHPDDQHSDEPHKIPIKTNKLPVTTDGKRQFKEYTTNQLSQITDEANRTSGSRTMEEAQDEKKHRKKKAHFYNELKPKHADKAWHKYKTLHDLPKHW